MGTAMRSLMAVVCLLAAGVCAADAKPAERAPTDIPAQGLESALQLLAKERSIQVIYRSELVGHRRTSGVTGNLTALEALGKLLNGTGLTYRHLNDQTVTIVPAENPAAGVREIERAMAASDPGLVRVARVDTPVREERTARAAAQQDEKAQGDPQGVPEILVKGNRSLNVDIKRSEDAPQPYVIFDRDEIQHSQAQDLGDFLRMRLPMNTASASNAQFPGNSSNSSTGSINLRGLGSNQTLILVDGRRMPGVTQQGTAFPPDINGIPLASIERIEVLPSTAGGIYGGGATGGVINIVLRRDYTGVEAQASYVNAFDTDVGNMRVDANASFSLEGGRTQVTLAATRSEANKLTIGDRDFAARAIDLQRRNNPAAFTSSSTPPLGATVNILSAQVVGGVRQPLTLDAAYGGTALGSVNTYIPLGYAGPASDSGQALVRNAGSYNLDVPAGMNGKDRSLLAAPSNESVSLNVRREFAARFEGFVDLSRLENRGESLNASLPNSVSNLRADAPNNPFQQPINVRFPVTDLSFEQYNKNESLRATGGLIVRLPHEWMGELDYGWNRSRNSLVSTSSVISSIGSCVLARGVGAGVVSTGFTSPCATLGDTRPALNVLQEGNTSPLDFTPYLLPSPNSFTGPFESFLKDTTLRTSGPVMDLPAGPLILSASIEDRDERIKDGFVQGIDTASALPTYTLYPERSQAARSYYLEARAPLVSTLELQASVRRDQYRTRSPAEGAFTVTSPDEATPPTSYVTNRLESTDYTVALKFAPVKDLALRASFGTGFLPPAVQQIAPTVMEDFPFSLGADFWRGGNDMFVQPFDYILGGSPDLGPEESESWSVGMILTPRFAPGLRLSVDYTRIEKVNEITTPSFAFIVENEDLFPGRVIRGPKLADDDAEWRGPIISVDTGYINLANSSVDAYDIQADYVVSTERLGDFRWYALGTWQQHYRTRALPTAAEVERVGYSGSPLEWRGNFGLDWSKGPLSVLWNAQYYDAYHIYAATASLTTRNTNVLNQGSDTVPRQIYHDLLMTWRFDRGSRAGAGMLANTELSVGIQNIFDRSPPIIASVNPTDYGYSTYGDPRMRRYSLSLRKSFGN